MSIETSTHTDPNQYLLDRYTDAVLFLNRADQHTDWSGPHREAYVAYNTEAEQMGNELFAVYGIEPHQALNNYERLYRGLGSVDRLRRAVDVTSEAMSRGYSLELPEEEIGAKVGEMITDYDAFLDAGTQQERYTERRQAKATLLEAAARDMCRRHGIQLDGRGTLTDRAMADLEAATGLPFTLKQRQGFPLIDVVQQGYAPYGPDLAANAQWRGNRDDYGGRYMKVIGVDHRRGAQLVRPHKAW